VEAHIDLYLVNKSGEQEPLNRVRHSFSSFDHVGCEKLTRARLRRALHADGSMLIVCEATFTVPPQEFESILLEGDDDGDESAGTPEKEGGLQKAEGAEGPAPTTVVVISGEGQLCQMTDCVLEAGGKAIPVHSHLLRQHSPMLGSMFDRQRAGEEVVGVLRLGQHSAEAVSHPIESLALAAQ
jgi:BTB/POZ domain